MRPRSLLFAVLGGAFFLSAGAPAYAQHDDWHHRGPPPAAHRDWRHDDRDYAPPPVVVAPPAYGYYAPPPVAYGTPGISISITFP